MRRSHSGKYTVIRDIEFAISQFTYMFLLTQKIFFFIGGYGYEPLPSTSSHNAIEDENERMTEDLKDKIHTLKSLSIDIGTEVKYQDKMLKGMVRLSIRSNLPTMSSLLTK